MTSTQFLFGAFTDVLKGFLSAFKSQPRIDNSWKREGIKATTVYPSHKVDVIGPRHKERLDFFQRQPRPNGHNTQRPSGYTCSKCDGVFDRLRIAEHLKGCNN